MYYFLLLLYQTTTVLVLNTTQIYSATVLEVRSLKCVSLGRSEGVARPAFLVEALKTNSSTCLVQPAFLGSWPLLPSLKSASSNSSPTWTTLLLPSFTYKNPCKYLAHTDIQANLIPRSATLIPYPQPIMQHKRFTNSRQGLGCGHLWQTIILPTIHVKDSNLISTWQ